MSYNITVEGGTTVRLPTAGKYCDRDIIVTAEGGGLALDVVTASALPDTVVDGQIVVITDTAPGTVYIDTDEPASPASGDVWIKLAAGADVALELSEESPYLGGGLTSARQWDGSEWATLDGYLGSDGEWVQFASALPPVGTALDDMTWAQISAISKQGLGSTYFSVGDTKQITINGTVGATSFSSVIFYACIIGFDHNSDYEGSNTIHFQIGKSAETSGYNKCLCDSMYGYMPSSTSTHYFNMNGSATNTGGWASSRIRTKILGSNYTPTSPLSKSLLAALPSDLRAVMRGVTKYTDNTGGGAGSVASNVTATTDYLWLLSEHEVFGTVNQGNSYESDYQKQYAYYSAGNSKVFYRHDVLSKTQASWWPRTPYKNQTGYWALVNTSGEISNGNASYDYGICPAFCV